MTLITGRGYQLTQAEVPMVAAKGLKITHEVYDGVQAVNNKLQGVNDKMLGVDDKVQGIEFYVLFPSM